MPKVTEVKRAIKPQKCGKCDCTIKKGEPYLWWAFFRRGKNVRCKKPECAPKASDLTASEFWQNVYGLQEQGFNADTFADLKSEVEDAVSQLNEWADDIESRKDNMPQGLQDGPTGEQLSQRAEALRDAANNLEQVEIPDDPKWEYIEKAKQFRVERDGADIGRIEQAGDKWTYTPNSVDGDEGKTLTNASFDDLKNEIEKEPDADDGRSFEDIKQECETALDDISCE